VNLHHSQPAPHLFSRRRGVALLLVLGLLAVVAVGLAALAHQTSAARRGADAAEGNLQRRWLWRSAEDALRSVRLFADPQPGLTSAADPAPRSNVSRERAFDWVFDLGHHRGRLRFADESAKADLNVLYPVGDTGESALRVAQLAAELGVATTLEPQPYRGLEAPWAHFSLPHQLVRPGDLGAVYTLTLPDAPPGPLDVFTLWGGGALQASRAPVAVVNAVLGDGFTDIETRRVAEHFAQPPEQRERLEAELVERLAGRLTDAAGPASVRGFLDNSRRRYGGLRVSSGPSATLRFNW